VLQSNDRALWYLIMKRLPKKPLITVTWLSSLRNIDDCPAMSAAIGGPAPARVVERHTMRTSTLISFVAAAILLNSCVRQSPPDAAEARGGSAQLPPPVQQLKELLQGKSPDEIRKLMIERFGSAPRDVGSGVRIEQWDVADGVLTFHSACGPTFTPKGQSTIHLLATHNPVRKNILGSYEMVSVAADDPSSTRRWLGNLHIEPDLSYCYKDSGRFPVENAHQAANFFTLHPVGTVEIQYGRGITDETLIETLPTGSVIAWLHFRAVDGNSQQSFTITTHEPARRLVFGASTPLAFEMDKAWESSWE
jgi:hypothetical protein